MASRATASVRAVTGRRQRTRTVAVAFSRDGSSAIGGTATSTGAPPSAAMPSAVGTEWRPSANTVRSRWSTVTGGGAVDGQRLAVTSASGVCHAVVGIAVDGGGAAHGGARPGRWAQAAASGRSAGGCAEDGVDGGVGGHTGDPGRARDRERARRRQRERAGDRQLGVGADRLVLVGPLAREQHGEAVVGRPVAGRRQQVGGQAHHLVDAGPAVADLAARPPPPTSGRCRSGSVPQLSPVTSSSTRVERPRADVDALARRGARGVVEVDVERVGRRRSAAAPASSTGCAVR